MPVAFCDSSPEILTPLFIHVVSGKSESLISAIQSCIALYLRVKQCGYRLTALSLDIRHVQ